ncbi:MAG: histidine phosphatase family protein [Bacillota bacterium]
MAAVYLIRHGRTRWNKEEVFRGQTEVPLDDWGRRQAQAVGRALQGKGIEAVITSPLGRAVETAELAKLAWGDIPLLVEPGLTDVHFGEWQGLSRQEVASRYPQLYRDWAQHPGQVAFPGGEIMEEAAERCWEAFQRICNDYRGRSVAVVTHRVITKILLNRVLGAGWQGFWKLRQDTACINLLESAGEFLVVQHLNETCHLKELGAGDRIDF